MLSKTTLSPTLLILCMGVAYAPQAAAHCCHDERQLQALEQSEFRSGVHGLNDNSNDRRLGDPPTTGSGLRGDSNGGGLSGRGLGQLGGTDPFGAYGAGSIGERGPGGLGGMTNGGLGPAPPRPR